MRDEASGDEDDAEREPRQRIQMLITARGGCRMPASRAGAVALHPCHEEEKGSRPVSSPKAERRITGRLARTTPITRIGNTRSGPRETAPSAAADPTSAHA